MSKKKLMILPIIAVVVAIMGLNVWAVPGSQQNWVKVYAGDKDITAEFDITQRTTFDDFKIQDDMDALCAGVTAKIKSYDSNLKPDDFKAYVGYDITPKDTSTLTAGPYKVVIKSAVASNEIYIMVHSHGTEPYLYSMGKGGEPTLSGVTSFSPFYVFTATSKTSPQTGDFAPAYIAMIGVALVSCGAIFAIRAKKSSKVTK